MATDWVPEVPPRLRKRLSLFTPHRDGFVRKHRGEVVFVLGKGRFLHTYNADGVTAAVEAVEAAWEERRTKFDEAAEDSFQDLRATSGLTFVQLASEFFEHLDHRVRFGRPKRMEAVTAWDYQRTINEFGEAIGADRPINDLGPSDFGKYAKSIAGNAASSFARKVAYIEAFIRWGMQLGRFGNNRLVREVTPGQDPLRRLIGPDLVKPSATDLRDERVVKSQAFTPAEIGKLWAVATEQERLWIGLGLNGAFDNGDIMGLTWRVVVTAKAFRLGDRQVAMPKDDRAGLVIDYRRRKRGRIRRIIPLLPPVACRLADHLACYVDREPADDDEVFQNADGEHLRRITASGPQNIVTRRFAKLMIRAGLRGEPVVTRDNETGKRYVKYPGDADGRGYRSLRTTMVNLAPTGYRDEIEIVMGHAHGQTILESYMETHGFTRLYELADAVWTAAFAEPPDEAWLAKRSAPASRRGKPASAGTSETSAPDEAPED